MHKIASVILLAFYAIGAVFSPLGIFSCVSYVPAMYAQCTEEDPDIGTADFILEHLLCMENVVEFFEHGGENDRDDAQSRPFQSYQTVTQTVVVFPQQVQYLLTKYISLTDAKNYALYKNGLNPRLHLNEIFHPPAV